MYNRYVPQQDGSYTRNRVPDQNKQQHNHPKSPPQPPQHQQPPRPPQPPEQPQHHHTPKTINPLSFIQQLLGKDFDTGDLIVILLLLLMAGDRPEERNNAILTIALYFLM